MASQARLAFNNSAEDIERLLEIHGDLGGDERGRRHRLEVLNKSAVVLITAFWEAFCEDLAAEALTHLINNVPSAASLPLELKKRIAKEIKAEANEIAVWDIADTGWKLKISNRLAALREERNRKLNTPKSGNIDELFLNALGLASISNSWTWGKLRADGARRKLDRYIELRGSIAHRGQGAVSCTKKQVIDYFDHIKYSVRRTDEKVNVFLQTSTGVPLWGA